MVRYADLAFYMTEYGGNIIPNEQFQRVITRAIERYRSDNKLGTRRNM